MLLIQLNKGIFPEPSTTTEQARMSSDSNSNNAAGAGVKDQQQQEVVYEMFIPFLYRGKDKESTERRVFWVFKQLNWGYISGVQVFGFDDQSKKNVTARVSYTRINPKATDLIEQLDAGETAQVHYEQGKPWFWNVVKYTRRAPAPPKATVEPQVTFKIKVKASGSTSPKARPSTPPTEPPAATEFKPIIKPSSNKFKILEVDGASSSNASDSEESK
jgi:hypothetical protein